MKYCGGKVEDCICHQCTSREIFGCCPPGRCKCCSRPVKSCDGKVP